MLATDVPWPSLSSGRSALIVPVLGFVTGVVASKNSNRSTPLSVNSSFATVSCDGSEMPLSIIATVTGLKFGDVNDAFLRIVLSIGKTNDRTYASALLSYVPGAVDVRSRRSNVRPDEDACTLLAYASRT